MKKWVLRFRAIDRKNFLNIKTGAKSVETRAATEKYRAVRKGDVLEIICGKARLRKTVKRVRIFSSIGVMVKGIGFKKIMPDAASMAEVRKTYYGYPGYKEKLKKYGIIAFYL